MWAGSQPGLAGWVGGGPQGRWAATTTTASGLAIASTCPRYLPITIPSLQDALAAKVEAERQRYEELKAELQAWAAGLTVACLAATFAFYGRCGGRLGAAARVRGVGNAVCRAQQISSVKLGGRYATHTGACLESPTSPPLIGPSCHPLRPARDVAASYGVGALGGLVYLRLLNRSVDSVGGGMGGALGQPRLLIPVVLALGYNRCEHWVG